MNNKKLQNNEDVLTFYICEVGNRTDKNGEMSGKLKGFGTFSKRTPYEMEDSKGVSVKLPLAAIVVEGYLPEEYLSMQLPCKVRIPLRYAQNQTTSKTSGSQNYHIGTNFADMLVTPLVEKS